MSLELKTKDLFRNQKGQTVLAMIVLMIIALMVGVTVSDRFIKGLRAITSSDNTTKAVAVAEAAIERLLVLPTETLEDFITFNNCGTSCYLEITDVNGQKLIANVTLSHMGASSDPYPLSLRESETTELSLVGYTSGQGISVCWNGEQSVTGMYIKTVSGATNAEPFAYNSTTSAHPENNFLTASSLYGYQNCFTLTASDTPLSIRLKSAYAPVDVDVLPAPGYTIPAQGIRIDSVGQVGEARKTVTVIKSDPFVPAIFDYVIYQKSDTDALSN